jgi:hypothetical protein
MRLWRIARERSSPSPTACRGISLSRHAKPLTWQVWRVTFDSCLLRGFARAYGSEGWEFESLRARFQDARARDRAANPHCQVCGRCRCAAQATQKRNTCSQDAALPATKTPPCYASCAPAHRWTVWEMRSGGKGADVRTRRSYTGPINATSPQKSRTQISQVNFRFPGVFWSVNGSHMDGYRIMR